MPYDIRQLLSAITERFEQTAQYEAAEVQVLIERLTVLDNADRVRIMRELPPAFFSIIRQQPFVESILPTFLSTYEKFVEGRDYRWRYAETIVDNMRIVFEGREVRKALRAGALHLAIRAAHLMTRFAAMDTCRSMVKSIEDDALGFEAALVLLNNPHTFIADIKVGECRSEAIRNALRQIQQS